MPSAVATLLPNPCLRTVDRFAVASNPGDTWAFLQSTCPLDLPWVQAVAAACSARDRLLRAAHRRLEGAGQRHPQLLAGVGLDGAFPRLQERPGREIVNGAIGAFWEPSAPHEAVGADTFAAFDEPGYGKLAWSLQVDPRASGRSWIGFELRGDATTGEDRQKLAAYWGRFEARSRSLRRAASRALVRRLGKPFPESASRLPGDELIAAPLLSRTLAVTVEAPPGCVWPWIVQMGYQIRK